MNFNKSTFDDWLNLISKLKINHTAKDNKIEFNTRYHQSPYDSNKQSATIIILFDNNKLFKKIYYYSIKKDKITLEVAKDSTDTYEWNKILKESNITFEHKKRKYKAGRWGSRTFYWIEIPISNVQNKNQYKLNIGYNIGTKYIYGFTIWNAKDD